ncbi:hypothetical protein KSZ_51400 [Dictyobacter formicarum]|uniref:Uncharacterized protein n=1 Tax=Dictyobacter formicarum TaxID=2778368 RepID=A0ABQ3VLP9_9CHLR|nr:hypothetical protein KSZ_51400 [Dictyobacter formicarum]
MAKATLLETSFLGLNNRGGRRLIETSTEDVSRGYLQRHLDSLTPLSAQEVCERNEQEPKPIERGKSAKRRAPTSGKPDMVPELL